MRTARTRLAALLAATTIAACQGSGSPAPSSPSTGPTGPTSSSSAPAASTGPASAEPTPASSITAGGLTFTVETFRVPAGSHPHDVAPASDGGVWYTGQNQGYLGWLDPATGDIERVPLGGGSAPHGVVSGPDGAAWVTDQGLDAIVRVTPGDFEVDVFEAPAGTSPHTAVFDHDGVLWFTGAGGWIGRLDPDVGEVRRYPAPRGSGPYGITVTPSNEVWFVSLQQSYLGRVDRATGEVQVIEPGVPSAGTRRVWSDSGGRLWVSYWNAGMLAMYDPATAAWREWDLAGSSPMAYSMYVDELDAVWLSDFGSNSVLRFDPATETFTRFRSTLPGANVRQMMGREGEAWGAESGVDRLIVFRYGKG
jgi:virginiamycin B lyase